MRRGRILELLGLKEKITTNLKEILFKGEFDTGATLDEITRILKGFGVENVFILTLTKT